MRISDRLGLDAEASCQTPYIRLLFYVGCTANADVAAEICGAGHALTMYATGSGLGSRVEMVAEFVRDVASASP
jgi:hypothetical protein